MSEKTIIAWTDHTFNPWMGCTKISEGCRNCYAATLTKNRMGLSLWGNAAPRQRTKSPWQHVSQWNRIAESGVMGDGSPRLCFTGSLMDWAEDRDDLIEVRKDMWRLIKASTNLHFQMLTKRTENIRRFLPEDWGKDRKSVV